VRNLDELDESDGFFLPGAATIVCNSTRKFEAVESANETTRASALRFWMRVNDGTVRLSPAADALAWRLRREGKPWAEVTEAVRIQHIRDRNARNQANTDARRARREYRKERGL
jgi:hypothetical protein